MSISQSYDIMSIEAKDIFAAMQIPNNKNGYHIRDKKGKIRLSKFINTLDDSLTARKLKEIFEKTVRRKFSFNVGKHTYTQHVINVKFSYSYKEWNRAGINRYVKAGYNIRELTIEDGVCLIDGELVAIQTNVEVQKPISQTILGKYFIFVNGHYETTENFPVLMSKADLRKYLYSNGFLCDGQYFVRMARSTGSSRIGNCLFVNSMVAEKIEEWNKCGLNIREGDSIDLASYESYVSLSMSSMIDLVEIKPEEILVIDDYISEFEDEVVAVTAPDNKLFAEKRKVVIKNDIWDGQSLADVSLFEKYPNKSMMVLRNRFFKTAAFNCNIQQWFKDNDITSVTQLNGFTLAQDISQIKLITTPNSVKYLKFGKLEDWLYNIDSKFGLVKTEKPTKYFGGRMVATHYQLLNTLNLSKKDVEALLEPTLSYLELIRTDPDVLRHHIGLTLGDTRNTLKNTQIKNKNEIVFKMLAVNNKFAQTKYYKDFRSNVIKSMVSRFKRGRILVSGNYSSLFGNPIEMLEATIGLFSGISKLKKGCIHCKRFEDGAKLLCSRSPHITMGNILLTTNNINKDIEKYFNLSSEIVCVNAIGENIQQKLGGADYDSDTMLITDNKLLISAAELNYDKFCVPTSFIDAQKINRVFTSKDKADLDIKTSVNKIGEIVNLSQLLNSLLWQRKHDGESIESLQELYLDIGKLSVASMIEIDSAKKEFKVNNTRELNMLRSKYEIKDGEKTVKPTFFKTITIENGYKLSDNMKYINFDTPIDYIQETINRINLKQSRDLKSKTIPFIDIVKKPLMIDGGGSYYRKDRALEIIKEAQIDVMQIQTKCSKLDKEDKRERMRLTGMISEKIKQCVDKIMKFEWSEPSLYLMIKEIDNKKNSSIVTFLYDVLFYAPNSIFFNLIKQSYEDMFDLVEDKNGDIKIYDFKYKKVKSSPKC